MQVRRILLYILLVFLLFIPESFGEDPYLKDRLQMVASQLKDRDIRQEKVLKIFEKVPRHLFVPKGLAFLAYGDRPLPIGEGQTISQPYIVALMTQELNLKPSDKVLEIGTGSGYQAAILAELVKEVYTIEIVPSLATSAEKRLKAMGYKNIFVKTGDGYLGWSEKAPFDAILITASPPKVPKPLIDQLKEGGKLIAPVGGEGTLQQLILYIKQKGALKVARYVAPVAFVPMTGKAQEK